MEIIRFMDPPDFKDLFLPYVIRYFEQDSPLLIHFAVEFSTLADTIESWHSRVK